MLGLPSRRTMLATLVRHRNLIRLSAFAPLALAVVASCVGTIDSDGGDDGSAGQTPEQLAATKAWTDKAKPQLDTNCNSCHNGSNVTYPGFLAGADSEAVRATLLAYEPQVVNIDAPQSSRLLTKGAHLGSAWTGPQASDVLEWIQAEKVAAGSTGEEPVVVQTALITPRLCTGGNPGDATCPFNDIPLDDIGIAGAKISFIAQPAASALYLQRFTLTPGTAGAYIEHPVVVSYPEGMDPQPDMLDRFFDTKLNLMATDMPTLIGGGAEVFVGMSSVAPIRIHFKLASAYKTDDGTGTGTGTGPGTGTTVTGCKKLEEFKTNAKGPLDTNCGSCHKGQNPNATSALALTGIDSTDDTMVKKACDQVRSRANLQDLNNSSLYQAPTPTNTTHPFRFPNAGALTAFQTPINVWLTAERDAP